VINRILAVITARGGSKGVPGKNIKTLAGKPLIAWSIDAAMQSKYVNRIVVSTDDTQIAETARDWGADVPFLRPVGLSQDMSPHVPVLQHAVTYLQQHEKDCFDYILLLQPTSPLRTAIDIDNAVNLAMQKQADCVLSVCQVREHPYLMHEIVGGQLVDFMEHPEGYMPRQKLPQLYVLNGSIYLIRSQVLLEEGTLHPENTVPYIMPPERSLQIDEPWDFYLADLLFQNV